MTRMPELEQALVAAGRRHYRRPAWRRAVVPVAVAAAVAAAFVLAAGLGSPERERAAAPPTPTPSQETVLPSGEPLTQAQVRNVERYGHAVPRGSFAVPAPPSSPDALGSDADEWLVLPREDEICVQRGGSGVCGTPSSFREHGLIGSILPAPDDPLDLPEDGGAVRVPEDQLVGSGPATMWGLVPPGFVRVVATGPGVDAEVRDQVFELTVPSADGLDAVRMFRRDGSSIVVASG